MTQARKTGSVGFWILGAGLALVVLARGLDGLQLRRLASKQAEIDQLSAVERPAAPRPALGALPETVAAGRQLATVDAPGMQLAQTDGWNPEDADPTTNGEGGIDAPAPDWNRPAPPNDSPWDGPVRQDRDKRREAREELAELRASQASTAYLHEWIFLLGTLTLVVGLTVTAATANGLARIGAMVMAAILLVSLYIGGIAWIGSVLNTVRGAGAM